jgi:hypothetical protein
MTSLDDVCRKIIGPEIRADVLSATSRYVTCLECTDRAVRDAIRDRNRLPQA